MWCCTAESNAGVWSQRKYNPSHTPFKNNSPTACNRQIWLKVLLTDSINFISCQRHWHLFFTISFTAFWAFHAKFWFDVTKTSFASDSACGVNLLGRIALFQKMGWFSGVNASYFQFTIIGISGVDLFSSQVEEIVFYLFVCCCCCCCCLFVFVVVYCSCCCCCLHVSLRSW